MGNEQHIGSFVSDVFSSNFANNYLLECMRWGDPKVCGVSVGLEPRFELFDAGQTYRKVSVVGKESFCVPVDGACGEWFVRGVRFVFADRIDWARFESFVSSLSGFRDVVSFEVFCCGGSVTFLLGCGCKDLLLVVCNLFGSFFPDCVFVGVSDPFLELNKFKGGLSFFDLSCPLPFHRVVSCDRVVGCFGGLFKTFSQLKSGECGFFQCLFVPVKNDVGKNVKALVGAEKFLGGRSPFGVSVSGGVKDVSKPLFACGVRFGCVSRSVAVRRGLESFASGFICDGRPVGFKTEKDFFKVFKKAGTFEMLSSRCVFRSGLLLDCGELSGLVHLPSVSVSGFGLRFDVVSGFSVSDRLQVGRPLGVNGASGSPKVVCLPFCEQNKSMWMLGASRVGKTVSMTNQFLELVSRGEGGAYFDPHRTAAFELCGLFPDEVLGRVVHLDFDDEDFVIDFNPFDEDDEELFGRLSVEFVNSFKHLFEAGSFHRMVHVLRMCVYALFVLKKNLSSIPALLSLKDPVGVGLRRDVVSRCRNDEVRRFWRDEFKTYSKDAFSPILNRFSALFMDNRALRIFSREINKVNIREIMDEGKILVVSLPASVDVSNLVGGLLISQIQKCALARLEKRDGCRRPFFLFVDEFHRFSTGRIIESVINETVKAGLHLCVANQETGQLSEELLKAVLSMPNILVFKVNFLDAKRMLPVFCGRVSVEEIVSLRVGECFGLVSSEVVDFRGFAPRSDYSDVVAKKVVESSREKFCSPLGSVSKEKIKSLTTDGKRVLDSF